MREIVLDTETTGLEVKEGHRIMEIGAIELENHIRTDRRYHTYINPQREIDKGAIAVHGITLDRLKDEPVFADIAAAFLEFIGDAKLVIHNASFDMGFINSELATVDLPPIPDSRVIDTLTMARRKFPGAQASLDALCKRFGIDNSNRNFHGALIDADLLTSVYVELIGGRQPDLILAREGKKTETAVLPVGERPPVEPRKARDFPPSPDELAAHKAFIAAMNKPIWEKYERNPPADDASETKPVTTKPPE